MLESGSWGGGEGCMPIDIVKMENYPQIKNSIGCVTAVHYTASIG